MNLDTRLTVAFLGHSGSGKGTQAQLLKEFLGRNDPNRAVHRIETGQLARDFMAREGHTQALVRETLSEGNLLPNFVPIYLWSSYLIDRVLQTDHVLFDGTPRMEKESSTLYNAMQFYGRSEYLMIVLDVSDETARERMLSRQRGGLKDVEEGIARKIEWYHREVEKVAQNAESMGVPVHRINGEPSIEEVNSAILHTLGLDSRHS